jgi:peroxiredoxin
MKRLTLAALVAGLLGAGPAWAMLAVGAKAPDFTATASLGGQRFVFSLARALEKGPVVLYFYPAAFTPGCTIEAHDFAEATDEFKALGATVIGVSHDSIDTLDKFSLSECRSKFAVAADPDQAIMTEYDAVLVGRLGLANRTSYVIAPDGSIFAAYTALDPAHHVEVTLAAVKAWRAAHGGQ